MDKDKEQPVLNGNAAIWFVITLILGAIIVVSLPSFIAFLSRIN